MERERSTDIGSGPSYWDVDELVREFKRLRTGVLYWETSAVVDPNTKRPSYWVRACYQAPNSRLGAAPRAYGWAFRGNGGATTMPAAMWHSLSGLMDILYHEEMEASKHTPF